MAKTAINMMKKTKFASKLDFNLRKNLVKCNFGHCIFGAESWTPRKVDQKNLESFECGV
jgi:hypothetical protein